MPDETLAVIFRRSSRVLHDVGGSTELAEVRPSARHGIEVQG
jgi:hypothetical protein